MLRLNKANFSTKVQEILERYYLQPINGSKKINLKDGHIERSIHGAMHASRATLWALVMQNLLQKLAPAYTESSLKKIAQFINADTDTVVLLILITMTCHDAARKGEGQDIWEAESGEIAVGVLIKLGLDDKHAKLFAKAITFKDKQSKYFNELNQLGINEQDYNAFDYIRKIVNLGDNLDLVRCVKPFKTQYIFDTLATVEGYDASLHDDIIMNLVKAIHQFIHEQRDMLFSCDIKDRKNVTVAAHKGRVSNKEKVQREHAENVFEVIFEEASNNREFQSYLYTLDVKQSKRYTGSLKFDPFIHGTNTSIFSTLVKSKFQVMSPLELMDEYQTAPMTGELTKGGYDVVGDTTVKEESIGKTSFAKMTGVDGNSYTLEKVLENYTLIRAASDDTSLDDFEYVLSRGLGLAFSNINLLLIYFTRARQTHESLDQVISDNDIKKLQSNLDATAQFYYFIQLLGVHIHPDFEAIERSGMAKDVTGAAYSLLTFEHIVGKIIEHKIDMKGILADPSPKNLEKALLVLEFPKKCVIRSGFSCKDKEVEFPITQFFCLEGAYTEVKYSQLESDYTFYRMSQNNVSGYKINDILEKALSKNLEPTFFSEMAERAKKHLVALDDRMQLFHKLALTPQSAFNLTNIQRYFLKKTFPIILVSENEDKITLHNNTHQEFRSITRLKLGSDIKMIATDTNDHRLEIMKFLELNHVSGVQVVLFSDLKTSKTSEKKPSEPYHHEGGIPTLKWLCAKQVQQNLSIFQKKYTASNAPGSICSKKNISESIDLVDDARKYSAIEFNQNAAKANTDSFTSFNEQFVFPLEEIPPPNLKTSNQENTDLSSMIKNTSIEPLNSQTPINAVPALDNTNEYNAPKPIPITSKMEIIDELDQFLKRGDLTKEMILDRFKEIKIRTGKYQAIHEQKHPVFDRFRLCFKNNRNPNENNFWHTKTYQTAIKYMKEAYINIKSDVNSGYAAEENPFIDYFRGNSPLHHRDKTSTRRKFSH